MVSVPFLVDLLSNARKVKIKSVTCLFDAEALAPGVCLYEKFDRLRLDVDQVEVRPVNTAYDEREDLVVKVGHPNQVTQKEFVVFKLLSASPAVDDQVINKVLFLSDLNHGVGTIVLEHYRLVLDLTLHHSVFRQLELSEQIVSSPVLKAG